MSNNWNKGRGVGLEKDKLKVGGLNVIIDRFAFYFKERIYAIKRQITIRPFIENNLYYNIYIFHEYVIENMVIL